MSPWYWKYDNAFLLFAIAFMGILVCLACLAIGISLFFKVTYTTLKEVCIEAQKN